MGGCIYFMSVFQNLDSVVNVPHALACCLAASISAPPTPRLLAVCATHTLAKYAALSLLPACTVTITVAHICSRWYLTKASTAEMFGIRQAVTGVKLIRACQTGLHDIYVQHGSTWEPNLPIKTSPSRALTAYKSNVPSTPSG